MVKRGGIILKDKCISNLDIINNAITDAKFVLNDTTPYKGIRKVFIYWISCLLVINLFLFIYRQIAINSDFIVSGAFYTVNRVFKVSLNLIVIIVYIIAANKVNMTLKEKNFLKTFVVFPVLLSLLKIMFFISYYLNAGVLFRLYDKFSFDLIITFLAIFYLFKYFKDKKYKYLMICFFIYMCITFFLKFYVIDFYTAFSINMPVLKIKNVISIINEFSLYQIVVFGLSIYFMKNGNNGQ